MKKYDNAKEELISRLTEIYNQLEELENTLDTSFSDMRNNMQMDAAEQISNCTNRIKHLEAEALYYEIKNQKMDTKEGPQRQPSIKLEFGYKLH